MTSIVAYMFVAALATGTFSFPILSLCLRLAPVSSYRASTLGLEFFSLCVCFGVGSLSVVARFLVTNLLLSFSLA